MEIIIWNPNVERFIKSLDEATRICVGETMGVLRRIGHRIEMPHSKSLGKGLFELRARGKKQVRVLYVYKNDKAYFLHGFVKKTFKISRKDIEYGRNLQASLK